MGSVEMLRQPGMGEEVQYSFIKGKGKGKTAHSYLF